MRRRILQAAADRFFTHGFYKVSIDELVGELRTSKSTVYKYFSSKEDLTKTLLLDLNKEIDDQLALLFSDTQQNYKEKIESITDYTGRVLARVSKAFFRDLRVHTPRLWDIYERARINRLNRFYRPLIHQGIEQGILRNDIDEGFLLVMYTKLTEILIDPVLFQDMPISNTEAYRTISLFFLEGALTEKGRDLFVS